MASKHGKHLIQQAHSGLKEKDDLLLLQIFKDLSARLDACKVLGKGEHLALIGKSLYRDLATELAYLPEYVKADGSKPTTALR